MTQNVDESGRSRSEDREKPKSNRTLDDSFDEFKVREFSFAMTRLEKARAITMKKIGRFFAICLQISEATI